MVEAESEARMVGKAPAGELRIARAESGGVCGEGRLTVSGDVVEGGSRQKDGCGGSGGSVGMVWVCSGSGRRETGLRVRFWKNAGGIFWFVLTRDFKVEGLRSGTGEVREASRENWQSGGIGSVWGYLRGEQG